VAGGPVTFDGRTRAALKDQKVYPPTEKGTLRTWVGVGGSPESVIRAAKYGFPLTLAIIGGSPMRFKPYVDLYRQALDRFGHGDLPIAVHSPGHVADTDQQAKDQLWPHYEGMINRIGRERGWQPSSRANFEQDVDHGALCVGSPDTVARKITATVNALGLSRFDLKYSHGTLPHDVMTKSLELLGTVVAPRVREAVA
jgi:alkanesulfonate monooxygenase SsuD/methylene tetrahydromethanopterin reductase-like flavin-dependent oxidoreductase (luciferase family)